MYNYNIPNTIKLKGEAVGNYNVDVLYYIHFYKVISDSSYKNEYVNLILEHKQSNGLYKTDNESTSKEYSNSQYLDSLLNNTEIHQDYSIYFQAISIGKGVNTSIVNKIDSNYNSIIEQIRNAKLNIDEDSILAIAQERFIEKTYYKEQLQSIYSAIKEASVEVNMNSIIAQVIGSKQFVDLTDNVNVVKELAQENKSSLEMLDDKIEMSVQESKLQVYLAQSTHLGINLVQNSCFLRGLDNFTLQGPTGQIVETTQGRVYYKILTSQVFSLRQEISYNLYAGDYTVGLDVYGSGSITINIYNSDSNSLISSDVISPELATPKRYYTAFKIKDITKVDLEIYTENADLSFGYIKLSRGIEDHGWTLSSDDTNYLSDEIKTCYEKVIKYYTNVVIDEDINSVINNLELRCKQLSAITNVTLTHPILKASTVLVNTSEYLSLFIDSYTDLISYLRTSEDKDYLNDKTFTFYEAFTKLVNSLVVIIDYIANYDTSKSNSVYIEAIQQDILDINTNMENLNTNLIKIFQDGILTSEEKSILRNNLSVLEREKAELDVRVAYYTTQDTIKDSEDVQLLSEYHNNYNTVYQDIITLINDILDKDEITQDMRYAFNTKYELYKQHTKVLQEQLLKVVSKYTSTQTQLEVRKVEEKISDLNKDLDTLKGLVENVSNDGILTTLEKRSLKNQLQEITHTYLNIKAEIDYYQSQDLLKGTSEISSLNSLEAQLDSSYNTVNSEINRLLTGNNITEEDVSRVDGYINNVSSKLQDLQSAISNCLLKITALETTKEINSLNTQINEIQGSVDSLVNFTNEAWLNGILSYTEAISQLDLVNRIKLQIQVFLDRVDTLLVNDFIKNNTTLVEKLGNAKRDVDTTFNTMEATINNASSDGAITEEEKTQFNTALSNFYSKLNYLRSVISEAESIIIQGESNAAYEKSKKYIDDNYQDVKDTVDKMNTFADEAWVDGIITKAETVTFTNLLDNLYKESLDMKKQCEVYTSAVLTPELQGTSELGKLATALASYESEYNKFYTAVEEIANFSGVTSKDKTDYNNSKNDYEEALIKLVQVLLECSKKVSEVKTNKALGFTDKDGNTTTVVDWVKNADIELTKEKIKMYVENTSTVLVTSTFIEENYLTKSELENTYATKSQISTLDNKISLSVKSSEMESYKQEFLTQSNSYTDNEIANVNNNLVNNYVTVNNFNSGIDVTKQNILSTVSQEYAAKSSVTDLSNNLTNNYASKSELAQTTNSITAKFSESGGYNLIRNGCAKNGTTYWTDNGGGISVGTSNAPTGDHKYFNSSFPSGIAGEWVQLKNNTYYTYSAKIYLASAINMDNSVPLYSWCNTTQTSGTPQLTVISRSHTSSIPANQWVDIWLTFKTAASDTVWFKPFIYHEEASVAFNVTELMLSEGSLPTPYSPHPSEIYDGSTKIDKDGVTVYSSSSNFYSNISSDGLNIYTKGNTTPVASFRPSGAFVDNLTVNTLNCEGLPQRASLRGIKNDYYVNTKYSGNALGEDTKNYSNSIQSILDRIKARSLIIDIDITIHIAQKALIDEAIEFKDFLGNGTVTLYWGYESKFIGTLKTSNTTVKLRYIGENDGTFCKELTYFIDGDITEREVLARHRVYLPMDTPNRFIIQSYFETQYCIFIRQNQTYEYSNTVTTNDYVFNVSNNGCIVSYRCDYVYHFCICYGTGAFTGYFGDNTGSTEYTHSGLKNNIRGVITEGVYTSEPDQNYSEDFGDTVEVLTPNSPIKRSSLYIFCDGSTELNSGSSSPGTSDAGTSSDYKVYNLSAEYQKILSTDTHTAYQSPGCIIGAVAGAEYTSLLFVPSSFVDDSRSLLESNKVISEIQLSLKRRTSNYNKEYGVDFYIYLGSYRAYMDVNIKEKQTCTVSLPTDMIKYINKNIAKSGSWDPDLRLLPATYAESGYAEFYSNEIYLYVTYTKK